MATATAKRSSTQPESTNVQFLGVDQITVDHALQSRCQTTVAVQKEFSESMLRGDVFPPIVVFWDEPKGKYWLADGFHRHGAAKNLAKTNRDFDQIRCEIHEGNRTDAIVYSAGANKRFAVQRSREDIRKAAWMLFGVKGWLERTANIIANHIGVSHLTATRYRTEYCSEKGIPVPRELIDSIGNSHLSGSSPLPKTSVRPVLKEGVYVAKVKGQEIKLGNKRIGLKAAENKFDFLKAKVRSEDKNGGLPINNAGLAMTLSRSGIKSRTFAAVNGQPMPGMPGLVVGFAVVTLAHLDHKDAAMAAIGRISCMSKMLDGAYAKVIVCQKANWNQKVMEVGNQLGIEFVTVDEAVTLFKS